MNARGRCAAVAGLRLALLMPRAAPAPGPAAHSPVPTTRAAQALFKQFSAAPGNIVFSPYSIGTAMAMALVGRARRDRAGDGGRAQARSAA